MTLTVEKYKVEYLDEQLKGQIKYFYNFWTLSDFLVDLNANKIINHKKISITTFIL